MPAPFRRRTLRLLAAVATGYTAALVLPRQRWRSRTAELRAGPWPPLEPSGGSASTPPPLEPSDGGDVSAPEPPPASGG